LGKQLKEELTQYKKELKSEFKEMLEKGFGDLVASVGKAVRDELQQNDDIW
jgi:hypothetical protein